MNEPDTRAPIEYFPGGRPGSPFSRAVRVGDTLYLSGQIGNRADGTKADDLAGQTRQTMENIKAELAAFGLGMDAIFKCTVMLADMDQWRDFNAVYLEYFAPDRLPARSAFGADKLVGGALTEVECCAYMPGNNA
ncbi:RidA family protein [Sphingosinicella soli]|uniref:Reactive intermediate/imine deaminase n=1 Tax=Sphingosinicella soli TaxID=333708 RepID=A0A7W7B2Q9_9SPHN|nr:RidA family protein [Sphingosinicella soli]MBB4632949.1 reactive intermediate/imine deaminase [Sphingosinicella soli]